MYRLLHLLSLPTLFLVLAFLPSSIAAQLKYESSVTTKDEKSIQTKVDLQQKSSIVEFAVNDKVDTRYEIKKGEKSTGIDISMPNYDGSVTVQLVRKGEVVYESKSRGPSNLFEPNVLPESVLYEAEIHSVREEYWGVFAAVAFVMCCVESSTVEETDSEGNTTTTRTLKFDCDCVSFKSAGGNGTSVTVDFDGKETVVDGVDELRLITNNDLDNSKWSLSLSK